jgi:hypothetical protein
MSEILSTTDDAEGDPRFLAGSSRRRQNLPAAKVSIMNLYPA